MLRLDAEERRWVAIAGAILVAAAVLRFWGLKTGLPYVYNADENAHFVPRAVGMFGHSYNPNYFVNPPGLTYLIHVALDLRFGSRDAVGHAMAVDRTSVFEVSRIVAALVATTSVALLMWAGRRMLGGTAGLVAGALLAVAFLPVHYAHFALNDAPTLAPLCLALLGVAGIHRHGRIRDYAIAGLGLGIACAFKYTGGIVVVAIVAAALLAPGALLIRVRGLVIAGVLSLAGFLLFNPFALLDFSAFRDGLTQQQETSGDASTGKLGLSQSGGVLYYLGTATWGLGWLPALAALGGMLGTLATSRRIAAILVPPPVLYLIFMGTQERFFARWLLPVYPFLCLLAGWATVALARAISTRITRPRTAALAAVIGALLCVQGAVYTVHNDVVLARPDTRQLARDWMVAHVPIRSKVVIEPFLPAAWAADAQSVTQGTGNGFRWNKWITTRARLPGQSGPASVIRFEDYERTTRPALISSYTRGGFCWVVTGSTQYGRAYADPKAVPQAVAYYAALARQGRLVYSVRPSGGPTPFSYDFSFNAYPLRYGRMGPEIRIYKLSGDKC